MLRMALCDDCTQHRESLQSMLADYQSARPGVDMQLLTYDTASALLDAMETAVCDLYLLDILMPGQNGIELARTLREKDPEVPILFLTSSADYAMDAFNLSASNYLLKPVDPDALFKALDKIATALEQDSERFILIATRDSTVKIPFSSIICVELTGRVLRLSLENGSALFSKTVRVPFASAIAPLLKDNRFLHAHKSFVLNMALVQVLTPTSFVMKDGTEIPVPRNKYAEAKNKYFNYLSEHGIGLLGGR